MFSSPEFTPSSLESRFGLLLQTVFLFLLAPSAQAQGLCFNPAVNFPAGDAPISVFAADLDGDNDLDLAVANYLGGNISVLKNNGAGTFAAAVNYAAGVNPWSVSAADLDGDNDADLAVANWLSDNVSVLMNNGDGSFAAPVNYPAGNEPISVISGDLDADNDADLAVVNHIGPPSVSVLLNNGDGTFAAATSYTTTGSAPYSVVAADLDGDNDVDLAVASAEGGSVSVLKNNGDGTFALAVNYPASGAYSVSAADLDGDNDVDLAVASSPGDFVSVLTNNGDGTFAATVNYATGDDSRSVFATDLDGDNDADLAVANYFSGNVSLLSNNGNGTFATAVNRTAGGRPFSVFAADLDGDNDADLAVANHFTDDVSVLINCTILPPGLCAGNALQFDGVDDEVLIPDSPSLNFGANDAMTIECWFYPTANAGHIIGRRPSCAANMNYQISFDASGNFDFFSPGGVLIRENFFPPLNQWTHVAGTYDGSLSRLYINGQERGAFQYNLAPNNDASPFRIGTSGDCQRFTGQVDEVRVWSVARSATDIQADLRKNVPPSTPELVGYWRFDEHTNDQNVLDLSSFGNCGTLGADASVDTDDPLRVTSDAPITDCMVTCGGTVSPIANWLATQECARFGAAQTTTPPYHTRFHTGIDAISPCVPRYEQRISVSVVASRDAEVCEIFGLDIASPEQLRRWNPLDNTYSWTAAPSGGENHGLGICVILRHTSTNDFTLYGHLDAVRSDLEKGTQVCAGESLGRVGNSYKQWLRRCRPSDDPYVPHDHNALCISLEPTAPDPSNLVVESNGGFSPHVHFEEKSVCELDDGTESYWGYSHLHPDRYGYRDPALRLYGSTLIVPGPVSVTPEGAGATLRGGPSAAHFLDAGGSSVEGSQYIATATAPATNGCQAGWIRLKRTDKKQFKHPSSLDSDSIPFVWMCAGQFQDPWLDPSPLTFTVYSPVSLVLFSPSGDSIGLGFNTIGETATYDNSTDFNGDAEPDDRISVTAAVLGDYTIRASTDPGADPSSTWSLGVTLPGQSESFPVVDQPVPPIGEPMGIPLQFSDCNCPCAGDPECDGITDILDVVTVIDVAFRSNPPEQVASCPYQHSDLDCSGTSNIIDVIRAINVAFRSADPATEFCDQCPF